MNKTRGQLKQALPGSLPTRTKSSVRSIATRADSAIEDLRKRALEDAQNFCRLVAALVVGDIASERWLMLAAEFRLVGQAIIRTANAIDAHARSMS